MDLEILFDSAEIYNAETERSLCIIPSMLSKLPDIFLIGIVVVLVLSASMSTSYPLVLIQFNDDTGSVERQYHEKKKR